MSIQSNINNTIGQASMLATLNPKLQEMGETIKAKKELRGTEKQLEELDKQSLPEYKSDEEATAPVFKSEAKRDYYNKLLDKQQDLSLYMQSKGKEGGRFFEKAATPDDIYGPILKAKTEAITRKYEQLEKEAREAQKAEEQRQKVEAIQAQKAAEAKAAQEFRSKQIRDLIMNPNLEVNNGTGNDTRR